MRKALLALSLISLVGIGSFANQLNGDKPQHHKMGAHKCQVLQMKKDLNLSEQQVAQIKTIMGNKDERKTEWTNFKNKKKELGQLMRSPNFSKEEALRKSDEIAKAQQEMHRKHIENFYAIRSVLTPEQLKKFNEKMAQREAKMMQEGPHKKMWEKSRPYSSVEN